MTTINGSHRIDASNAGPKGVTTTPLKPDALHRARAARHEASAVLSRLLSARRESEERLAALGRPDPMKQLTGSSALDRAIDAARGIVERLEQVEADLDDGARHAPAPTTGRAAYANGAAHTNGATHTNGASSPALAGAPRR